MVPANPADTKHRVFEYLLACPEGTCAYTKHVSGTVLCQWLEGNAVLWLHESPDEADQFPGNGNEGFLFGFALQQQSPISFM